jgi:threonine dehydrogenase-like Zn-dependent dehydrogenase
MLATPQKQRAVQLLGPDRLVLNLEKAVPTPGPHQLLCRVEAVGLCFSDLKLLKQFSDHPRKSEVVAGLGHDVLSQISSYVPGDLATVPGHEALVQIEDVGPGVTRFRRGERYLVQADYRWLRTEGANGAFGYNFEGALQEYVLMDERAITSPEGEVMLIPASPGLSAAAIALVEPWACVEDAYRSAERQGLKPGGRLLVVADTPSAASAGGLLRSSGRPAEVTVVGSAAGQVISSCTAAIGGRVASLEQLQHVLHRRSDGSARHGKGSPRSALQGEAAPNGNPRGSRGEGSYDDIVYLGSQPETVERLWDMAAPGALINLTLCGGRLGRRVATPVGSVHYRGLRIIGTTGSDPAAAMTTVPASGEIREGDAINVIGAAGPMGAMHVIRDLCQGVMGVSVWGGDVDDARLAVLRRMAEPIARQRRLAFRAYHASREVPAGAFSYVVVMVPAPRVVAEAVDSGGRGAIINIFAGIPAGTTAEVDLDRYVGQGMYLMGTSGSTLEDMRVVLAKVAAGTLDTNLSVAAVSDLEGAIDGLRAVERREISGKVIVYPACRGLGMVRLSDLPSRLPRVAEKLRDGVWTREAEEVLLATFGQAAGRQRG